MCMTNLFAFRATDPNDMKADSAPEGADNNFHILRIAKETDLIVAAWGTIGEFQSRANFIRGILNMRGIPLYHLGLNGDGSPKHPLYLKKKTEPILWN